MVSDKSPNVQHGMGMTTPTPNPYHAIADAAPTFWPGTGRDHSKGANARIPLLHIRNAMLAWDRGYAAALADRTPAERAAPDLMAVVQQVARLEAAIAKMKSTGNWHYVDQLIPVAKAALAKAGVQ